MKTFIKLITFVACSFLVSPAFAGLILDGEYSQLYQASGHNTDQNGQPISFSSPVDLRFYGIGARYVFHVLEDFRLEPFIKFIGPVTVPSNNTDKMAEGGLSFGYQFGSHIPFASVLYTYTFDNGGGIGQQPQLGYQLGYRFAVGPHTLFVTHSWRMLRNEFPPYVNDQTVNFSMWAAGYGFEFN